MLRISFAFVIFLIVLLVLIIGIAAMFHFESKPMFEVSDTAERKNVKVSFE